MNKHFVTAGHKVQDSIQKSANNTMNYLNNVERVNVALREIRTTNIEIMSIIKG